MKATVRMVRPRKIVDTSLILPLREAGLSYVKIANRLGISHDTLTRRLKDYAKPLRKTTQNPYAKPPPSSDVPVSTNTTTPAFAILPQLSAHHIAHSIAYVGKQPKNSASWAFGNTTASRYEGEGYVINAYKSRLVVWVSGVKGDTTEEIVGRARGRARGILAQFCARHALAPDWATFTDKSIPEYNLTNEALNEALIPILGEDRQKAKEAGLLPGDSTHPDQVEAVGLAGAKNVDSLMWLLKEFPKDWAAERGVVKDLAAQITLHLSVMKGMEANNERIANALEEMRNYYKEMRSKG